MRITTTLPASARACILVPQLKTCIQCHQAPGGYARPLTMGSVENLPRDHSTAA
jgi:hypothetical protein